LAAQLTRYESAGWTRPRRLGLSSRQLCLKKSLRELRRYSGLKIVELLDLFRHLFLKTQPHIRIQDLWLNCFYKLIQAGPREIVLRLPESRNLMAHDHRRKWSHSLDVEVDQP